MLLFLFFLTYIVNGKLISTGNFHTCVIQGSPYCWGVNDAGQLGDGTLLTRDSPTLVPLDAAEVSCGLAHTCFLLVNGSVACTGNNTFGQLGNGNFISQSSPVLISGLNATKVVSGERHTCVILQEGTVSCFGENTSGKLANLSLKGLGNQNVPVMTDPTGGTGNLDIALGGEHTCVLNSDGGVQCSGKNTHHQVDDRNQGETDGTFIMSRDDYEMSNFYYYTWSDPLINSLNSNFLAISAGEKHTCGIVTEGKVLCWGANYNGQCGDQTTSFNPLIMTVVTLLTPPMASFDAGGKFTCGVMAAGSVRCWGDNTEGQFAGGAPQEIVTYSTLAFEGGVQEVSSGVLHACVLFLNGTVGCAGTGVSLGDGAGPDYVNAKFILVP